MKIGDLNVKPYIEWFLALSLTEQALLIVCLLFSVPVLVYASDIAVMFGTSTTRFLVWMTQATKHNNELSRELMEKAKRGK